MQGTKWIMAFVMIGLLMSSPAYAQWARTYGGANYDCVYSLQQTQDRGYIVAAWMSALDKSNDIWLLKLNSDGTIGWQRAYGGEGEDNTYSLQHTQDGGYIVAGWTNSFGAGSWDIWVLKLNSDGTIAWQKTYGEISHDCAHSVQQTQDGGYIVAGWTSSFGSSGDFWVLKLNSDGTIAWQRAYGGEGEDHAYSVQQTQDGGYIVAGYIELSRRSYDFWVLKLNSDGTIAWQKAFGGSSDDGAMAIHETQDGGYIVAGCAYSFGAGSCDSLILKLNPNGTIAWQKTYGGDFPDCTHCIQQTQDGGYIVGGCTYSFGVNPGQYDSWVFELDVNGEIPNCSAVRTSNAIGFNTMVVSQATSVTPQYTTVIPSDTFMVLQDTSAETSMVCGPLVSLILIPDSTRVPQGDTLGLQATATNNSDLAQDTYFATNLTLPNGMPFSPFGYLFGPVPVILDPYGAKSVHISHTIPGIAPLGTYTYHGYVGKPGVGIVDEDQFDFVINQAQAMRDPKNQREMTVQHLTE